MTPSSTFEYPSISWTLVTRRRTRSPCLTRFWNSATSQLSMNVSGTLIGSPVKRWIIETMSEAWNVSITGWPVWAAWNAIWPSAPRTSPTMM